MLILLIYDVQLSNNNTNDALISRCKECRSLVQKSANKLNNLALSIVNSSKFQNINIISGNSVKATHKNYRLRTLNVNLKGKMTRLKNKQRLKKLGQ